MHTALENKKLIVSERDAKVSRVRGMPYYYHVHIFMPCNQKCIMCVPDGHHPRDTLSLEAFEQFFERVRPYAEHLTLIGGEPLLYPWINEVIELLSGHDVAVTINTNATMLDEDLSRRLLSLHELHLKCSIDAVTRETYLKIRGTDVFDRVRANLQRFSELAHGRPEMRQILVFVVMKENLHEVLPFIDYAKTLSPQRVAFHPVRHVRDWVVENNTGWTFDGREQSCEFFRDEYNELMTEAVAKCDAEGLEHDILFV